MNRRQLLKVLALSGSGLLVPAAWAAPLVRVKDIRMWTAPDSTRVVLDLDRPVTQHKLYRLQNPERLVLEVQGVTLGVSPGNLADPVVKEFRVQAMGGSGIRGVFELHREVKSRSFVLPASVGKNPRLVIDLFRLDVAEQEARPTPQPQRKERGVATVAIDAGHGGEDPGAVGARGTQEKHITLSVATKLERLVNGTRGFQARLTRTGDYYVPLRQRVSIARRHEPDLFMSLHADAFVIRSARGASVYCLAERGKPSPDRAINQLVARENSADLIGGVDLKQVHDPEVAEILMDLSQRDSINRAMFLGEKLLSSLRQVTPLKYDEVEPANFAVLKAPDMPSVLVEMAFLSNPEEEELLKRESHQNSLAASIFEGMRGFLNASRNG